VWGWAPPGRATLSWGHAVTAEWWVPFAGLTTLAVLTQLAAPLFVSRPAGAGPVRRPYLAFLFAGVLLLPPIGFALLAIITQLLEWAHERWTGGPAWRFNSMQIVTPLSHLLAGLLAGALYRTLLEETARVSPIPLISILCAIIAYVAIQHLISGQAQVLLHGVSWQTTGALQFDSLLPDFLSFSLGATIALLWAANPWQILLILPPLVLLDRALQVPALRREARTDSKTGLLNARAFHESLARTFGQAERNGRPLTLIMTDLDFLRNVNNTYGHLAGDTVLAEIGRTIAESIREYDLAGRFGGEEFAIVLPDTELSEGLATAERLRQAVAARRIIVETSPTPIQVTMSLGLAGFPDNAANTQALIHAADMAVYQAKLRGRNCVVSAADIPHFVKLATTSVTLNGAHTEIPAPQPATATSPALAPVAAPANGTAANPARPAAAAPVPPADEPSAAAKAPGQPLGVRLLVGGVVACAVVETVAGGLWGPHPDFVAIGLFAALTAIFEFLQVNVYGNSTISVAVATGVAIGMISGLPGLAIVSAVVALTHYIRTHNPLFATAFNWGTHVLAGTIPMLVIAVLGLPIEIKNLALLAIPVIVASLAYFVVDTGLIACAIGISMKTNIYTQWRKQFQWLAPHYLVLGVIALFLDIAYTALGPAGVLVFTLPVLMMRHVQQQYSEHTKESVQELKRLNDELAQANREVIIASHAIKELNDELFRTLAKILDARDPYVGGHAAQVSRYATAIASELGLPPDRIELVRQAGFLHDIGKIAISEQVLHKPSRLTDEEYEYIKTHAAIGADLLETSRALRHLAPFVRGHHERWDGLGYPLGLCGEAIPLEARILAVCDAVEAMASDRPYQRGKSVDEVIAEVRRCSGSHFDPQVVEVLVRLAMQAGTQFIINSAREVTLKQREALDLPALPEGLAFGAPAAFAPVAVPGGAPPRES
jgi:diguanylate cyclase (GGDEF)-like protein/putative nucleotidyltransferase with HDIG domain